jgi:hypothetical protein
MGQLEAVAIGVLVQIVGLSAASGEQDPLSRMIRSFLRSPMVRGANVSVMVHPA